MLSIQPFLIQLSPEILHRGIVPAVSLMVHVADKSMLFCRCLIIQRAVLASQEGVYYPPYFQNAGCIFGTLCMGIASFSTAITNSLIICLSIDMSTILSPQRSMPRKVEPAFIRRDVCDVAYHFLSGAVSGKIPVQNIFLFQILYTPFQGVKFDVLLVEISTAHKLLWDVQRVFTLTPSSLVTCFAILAFLNTILNESS